MKNQQSLGIVEEDLTLGLNMTRAYQDLSWWICHQGGKTKMQILLNNCQCFFNKMRFLDNNHYRTQHRHIFCHTNQHSLNPSLFKKQIIWTDQLLIQIDQKIRKELLDTIKFWLVWNITLAIIRVFWAGMSRIRLMHQ